MNISLYGGPFDGSMSNGPSHLPLYIIATNHTDRPVYKRVCCCKSGEASSLVPYVFVGYENSSYIYEEKELPEVKIA